MVFGIGGGGSRSRSDSETGIWGQQAKFLREYWPVVASLFESQNREIFGFGQALSQEMQGRLDYAGGAYEDIISGRSPGQSYLAGRIGQGNPYLERNIASYGQDIARNLAENILPELRSGGVAAGAPGGSRAYIAQGLAARGAQEEFAQGANQMRMMDLYQGDQLAGAYTAAQMGAAGGMAGLAEAGYNLGMAPYSAAWMPALNYRQAIGPAIMQSESESDSDSFDFSF